MPDHALELTLTQASSQAVLALWAALHEAGLPSLADHGSASNAPHLTLAAAPALTEEVVSAGAAAVPGVLPAQLAVRGLVVLGTGRRVALALLVEPDPDLAAAVAVLRARVPGLRHSVWVPHVSLALRVPRDRMPEAWSVLQEQALPQALTADRVRWWDPDLGQVRPVGVNRSGSA